MPSDDKPEVYAALDLGSNSFHLLIARFDQSKLIIIDTHKDMVRFAAGLDKHNTLSDEAIERALASLKKMAERLCGVPADHIRIVGTNTLRSAINAESFISQAENILPSPINIISGTEEARLIYLGVANDFSPGDSRRLVVDIGGGSTELVVGAQKPQLMESLDMGCVSFSRRYFPDGKLSESAFKKAHNAAARELAPYIEAFRGTWDEAVGASGTIRTIGRIVRDNALGDSSVITRKSLTALRDTLLEFKSCEDVDLKGLSNERQSVLPGGLSILLALFEELDINQMQTSDYAIREGIIHDLAGRLHHHDTRESTINHLVGQYHVDTSQAQRICKLALRWLPGVKKELKTEPTEAELQLRWASALHEIGLAIAHGGYHKHGAYILNNADMPGFSRQEQARLAFLVLNHRRKPKISDAPSSLKPDWLLVALFRLACILHRRRQSRSIPKEVTLNATGKKALTLTAPESWLNQNPLTRADLDDEQELIALAGVQLNIEAV
ncbi:exopolyphosphatase/guanosine-5'-triphosphate,3'-diphosphate pyrophosphatase [Litorivivens lipolytica]|uniref:Exopolyphosphatase/guanosine-5'-triphosphate, 3'-diphosphate pyrophosphatase n=1 Tax=Litorivivens lipolytica TaxID=1524264 RepID=A0A7W4W3N1_9GAMM|nr:Ppx/GppA phosphatase family protein [Litorivivens lipolytica]MBB3046841.1 exopolyphosphatase/guanosine-5'-triphosphate,3'-diphosphate pyrophosphatase [Litorivivens lipolytica]